MAVVAAGTVASLVIAWVAYTVGVRPRFARPPWWGERALRDTIGLPGPTLARALFYLAVGVLGLAWLGLVALARTRRVATVAVIAALWALPLAVCPPLGSRDVYSYLAHGELAAADLDPGGVTPRDGLDRESPILRGVDPIWRDVVSAYGPLATGLSEVAVRAADHDVVGAILIERAYAAVGVVLLGAGVVALTRTRPRATALAIAVASPLTLVHLIGGAHNEGLMVGLAMAGVAVAELGPRHRARWIAGVVLVGLGAAVKVSVILASAYLGWRGPRARPDIAPVRPRLVTLAITGVITLATIQVVALVADAGWGWVGGAGAGGKVLTLLSITSTIGYVLTDPFTDTQRELQQSVPYNVVRGLGVALSAAIAAVLLWRSPRLGINALGWALLAVAVLGPAVHPWYLTWGLPFLAISHQGRAEPWLLAAPIVATLSARPQGGSSWPNLGSQPWRILVLVAAGLAVAAAVRRLGSPRATPAAS